MGMNGRNGCRSRRATLLRYADGELDPEARLDFEMHQLECGDCRDAVEFHLLVEEVLHLDAGVEPDHGFEDRMIAGIRARIAARGGAPAEPRRSGAGKAHDPEGSAGRIASLRLSLPRAAIAAAALIPIALWMAFSIANAPADPGDRSDRDAGVALASNPAAPPDADAPRAGELPAGGRVSRSVASGAPDRDDPTDLRPERLLRARQEVREALLLACASHASPEEVRDAFEARTAELRGARWPVEGIVLGAIDDADPELANAAIRGVAALGLTEAVPAVRRATLRRETAPAALMALGDLGARSDVDRLRRGLDDPRLFEAALAGLERLGTAQAARAIAERLADPARAPAAASALARLGTPGVAELLRASFGGNPFARDALDQYRLPAAGQFAALLDPSSDPPLLLAVLERVSIAGAAAADRVGDLLDVPEVREAALDALVDLAHPAALAEIGRAAARESIGADRAEDAVDRVLAQALDPAALLKRACREPDAALALVLTIDPLAPTSSADTSPADTSPAGTSPAGTSPADTSPADTSPADPFAAALTRARTERAARVLGALICDPAVPPPARAEGAMRLAAAERLDPEDALAAAASVLPQDADAAARMILAAARAGIPAELEARLGFLPRAAVAEVLEAARTSAGRWRRDGVRPAEHEHNRIARILRRATPRL